MTSLLSCVDTQKGTSRRVWISDADLNRLSQASEKTNLSQVEILSQIVHGALVSIEQSDYRLTFPVRFAPNTPLENSPYRVNEPTPTKPRK